MSNDDYLASIDYYDIFYVIFLFSEVITITNYSLLITN